MTNLLLVSQNPQFSEDLSAQIKLFDENFAIFFPQDKADSIDMILLDENYEFLPELKAKYPYAPLIFLTNDETFSAPEMYKIITKPFWLYDLLVLLSSCINIAENNTSVCFNNYELWPAKKEILCVRTGKIIRLTEKEVAIIMVIVFGLIYK